MRKYLIEVNSSWKPQLTVGTTRKPTGNHKNYKGENVVQQRLNRFIFVFRLRHVCVRVCDDSMFTYVTLKVQVTVGELEGGVINEGRRDVEMM